MEGKRQRSANKLQSPGTGEVHHVCQSVLRSASYTHPPEGRPTQANTGQSAGVTCRVARRPSPSALSRAYYYGTVCSARFCWMAGCDRVQIRTAHLKPISRACPATLLKLGGCWGKSLENMRTGGACRNVIILAGSACSHRYLVPSVLGRLVSAVSAACCTVLQMENSSQRQRDHPSMGNEKQMGPSPPSCSRAVLSGCTIHPTTAHQRSIFSGCF